MAATVTGDSLSTASPDASSSRTMVYTAHLQNVLLPELEATRRNRLSVEYEISEYEHLRAKLDELEEAGDGPIETLTELGAGVWVDARISNTNTITLDLGLDIHLDLSIHDAREYIVKKVEILKKKREALGTKIEHLVWQIERFHGAMTGQNFANQE